jgi:hypothetical protein
LPPFDSGSAAQERKIADPTDERQPLDARAQAPRAKEMAASRRGSLAAPHRGPQAQRRGDRRRQR